jgi:hypothetical protein
MQVDARDRNVRMPSRGADCRDAEQSAGGADPERLRRRAGVRARMSGWGFVTVLHRAAHASRPGFRAAPTRQPAPPRDRPGRRPRISASSAAVSAAARFERGTATARSATAAGTGTKAPATMDLSGPIMRQSRLRTTLDNGGNGAGSTHTRYHSMHPLPYRTDPVHGKSVHLHRDDSQDSCFNCASMAGYLGFVGPYWRIMRS